MTSHVTPLKTKITSRPSALLKRTEARTWLCSSDAVVVLGVALAGDEPDQRPES